MAYVKTGKRTPFQDPMACHCIRKKIERSGEVTKHLTCWWYMNGKRKFKSLAISKYGYDEALKLTIKHLQKVNPQCKVTKKE